MMNEIFDLIDKLNEKRSLTFDEYLFLVENKTKEAREYAAALARERAREHYSNKVFIRGLIEISNICKKDCLYCGIRKSNPHCNRYRLSPEDILLCTEQGYSLGFRTFVLQGGEDAYYTDELLCSLISDIKKRFPDCAVTLSLGERSYESYRALREAGADRYLLRHETATREHYEFLHPKSVSFDERMRCLYDLKSLGYQTGCGFMVGSPGQRAEHLARDLKFIEEFSPQMCGIGPFIPCSNTPFENEGAGDVELTLYLLSLIRLIKPTVLLPATTALGTASEGGRERGILAGANVVMPNLSPESARKNYTLYNNKLQTGAENAYALDLLSQSIARIGYEVVTARGDAIEI